MTLTEALHVLHRAGKIRTPWLGGMLVGAKVARSRYFTEDVDAIRLPDDGPAETVRPYHVHLFDPATVGVLAALAREAAGDPTLTARSFTVYGVRGRFVEWRVGEYASASTEGEAWAAVLIAEAERCSAEVGT